MPRHPRWTHTVFTDDDLDAIAVAVAEAERRTSAELRVHLDRRLPRRAGGALPRARAVFTRLGMHRTAERNGVLIYLALADHRLAVVGDEAVHARVGADYWERVRDLMVERLRRGAARDAVLVAVADIAGALERLFPRRGDDVNELSDRVSMD